MNYVKDIMALGVLIDPEANKKLTQLSENEVSKIIDRTREERPLILTCEIIDNFMKKTSFKIIKTHIKPKKMSVQEYTDMLNKRYEFAQDILLKKVELTNIVSINKCTDGKVSVIGMVKTKEQNNGNIILEIEDKTGTVRTIVAKDIGEKIILDDIIAVTGNFNNKLLFGEKVVYPDVPLRKVNYSNANTKISFIINHDFSKETHIEGDYIFVGNCDNVERLKELYPRTKVFIISDKDVIDGNLQYISNPTYVEVDGIIFLVMFDYDPLNAIKKRFLPIGNSDFIIDPIPDVIFTNKDINANYKSITITSEKCVMNLKDRNITKI